MDGWSKAFCASDRGVDEAASGCGTRAEEVGLLHGNDGSGDAVSLRMDVTAAAVVRSTIDEGRVTAC